MKFKQNVTQELNSLFRCYPADFIEVALLSLMPAANNEIDEHTGIEQLFYAELNNIIIDNLAAYQKVNINNLTDVPENQALADANAIVSILTAIIPIGYVFFQQGDANNGSLTIVLDQYDYKPIYEIHEAVNFSLMAYQKITFEVCAYGTMANLISNGHFYYATLCVQKNCIYQNGAHFSLPLPNPVLFAATRLNAITLFKQNSDKAVNFMDGAKRYLEHNENTMAVFMLQQACEFTYRSLVLAFNGKNIKSHELVLLRKYALHYVPQIIGLFYSKPKKELRLLTLLQEAYVKARYENAYHIEHTQAVMLMEATLNLMKGVEVLFEAYLLNSSQTICS